MTQRKKNHHTVPCSYLKWFVEQLDSRNYRKSNIFQFDRKNRISRKVCIDKCGIVKKNINTLYSPEWYPSDILETSYWENQDIWITNVVKNIEVFNQPNTEDYSYLYGFISSMSHRSDIRIQSIKDELIGGGFSDSITSKTDFDLHKMWIKRTQSGLEIFNNNFVLWVWLHRSQNLLRFMLESSHYFLYISWDMNFITSDNPVSIFPKWNKWNEIFFPITSKIWIFISQDHHVRELNGKILSVEEDMIKPMNDMTALCSDRYLYSNTENQLSKINIPNWLWRNNNFQFYF